jgi:hypothetical protein
VADCCALIDGTRREALNTLAIIPAQTAYLIIFEVILTLL